jgi:hypothetical protein
MHQSFTDFKNNFYGRITDFSLFDCGGINLFKVVLDGLKVNYVQRSKVRSFLFYPLPVYNIFCKIKGLIKSKNEKILINNLDAQKDKSIIISDIGRILVDGNAHPRSLYFENIIKVLGKNHVSVVADKIIHPNFNFDINLLQIHEKFVYLKLRKEELEFRQKLLILFDKIKISGKFSKKELENIKYAIHNFFHQYKIWNRLLDCFPNAKKCYFVCHYHKEGQIYALKQRKINCIELQHGLIAPQDIFYSFPSSLSAIHYKALFADKILVYGNHWKNVLMKGYAYSNEQIDVLGYYHYDDFSANYNDRMVIRNIICRRKAILITTQTYLHKKFIDFTLKLLNSYKEGKDGIVVVIKPHPSEKTEIYKRAFNGFENVFVVNYPLPLLFEQIKIHISIYSTTLFDALRYGVKNFVFKAEECNDYVDEILNLGIAEEIVLPYNLLDDHIQSHSNIIKSQFYIEMNASVLLKNS